MNRRPAILISPNVERKGDEFGDLSISLSETYQQAILNVGGIPVPLPGTINEEVIAECVARCDGVLLTGGEDIDPGIYAGRSDPVLCSKVVVTPDGGHRDLREILLVQEVFRQSRPLLAICRGHQVLNVALGGTLVLDIQSQVPGALEHRRRDKRSEVVHEVRLTPDSLLSKITGKNRLDVNSTHHQAVDKVAEPLQVVGSSEDGVVEVLELHTRARACLPFLLSVQFHPERLADRYAEHRAIFASFVEACAQSRKEKL